MSAQKPLHECPAPQPQPPKTKWWQKVLNAVGQALGTAYENRQ